MKAILLMLALMVGASLGAGDCLGKTGTATGEKPQATPPAVPLPSKTDLSLLQEVRRAHERGLRWLVAQQKENGSWNNHAAFTGLAVTALLRSGRELSREEQEAVERGVKFILTCVKPTGAIYGGDEHDRYPNYSTSICTMALLATGDPKHTETILSARRFLLGLQYDEADGITPDNPSYGGIGYGRRGRPDLSNHQWAAEAIRLTEALVTEAADAPQADSKLYWQRAIMFLTRTQNLPSHNDQPWANSAREEDVGGFAYIPGDPTADPPVLPHSFANEEPITDFRTPLRSTGSMTYAGLKSFLYAEMQKHDPRVVAAVNWLRRNYTLEENPGLGRQGLYYYFHTLAKALTAYGEDTFKLADGREVDWRHDLLARLVSLQNHEGYWQNDNNRWWENDPVLCTCYSLLAIELLLKRQYP